MDKRYTQPALLWALAAEYAAQKWPDYRPARAMDVVLYLYPESGPGAWMLNGPKLYWQDDPVVGDHWTNCDQDALEDADIAEVVLMHRRLRDQQLWRGMDAAVIGMGGA